MIFKELKGDEKKKKIKSKTELRHWQMIRFHNWNVLID